MREQIAPWSYNHSFQGMGAIWSLEEELHTVVPASPTRLLLLLHPTHPCKLSSLAGVPEFSTEASDDSPQPADEQIEAQVVKGQKLSWTLHLN